MQIELIILSICSFLAIAIYMDFKDSLKDAVSSIKELNANVAVIIHQTKTNTEEISGLKDKQEHLASGLLRVEAKLEFENRG